MLKTRKTNNPRAPEPGRASLYCTKEGDWNAIDDEGVVTPITSSGSSFSGITTTVIKQVDISTPGLNHVISRVSLPLAAQSAKALLTKISVLFAGGGELSFTDGGNSNQSYWFEPQPSLAYEIQLWLPMTTDNITMTLDPSDGDRSATIQLLGWL